MGEDRRASCSTSTPTGIDEATGQPIDVGGQLVKSDDGRDRIFGDDGNDWIVGGTDCDWLFGGFGDDLLNLDDNLETNGGRTTGPRTTSGSATATSPSAAPAATS